MFLVPILEKGYFNVSRQITADYKNCVIYKLTPVVHNTRVNGNLTQVQGSYTFEI